MPFHVLEEVTRIDTEELQDSSDENSKKTDEATESGLNCFAECADLGINFAFFFFVKEEAKRYLRGLYEQRPRGKDSFFHFV